VNLEVDVIAKYVEALLAERTASQGSVVRPAQEGRTA
jgi:riboflavin synthase alpha subunit